MKSLFKKSKPTNQPIVETKTVNETIEEIHESFYTEVDRLLSDAKIAKSLHTDKQALIDKCEKLESLGFTSTAEIKEAKSEIQRLKNIEEENKKKADLIEAINYFSFKYPNQKFISEESVKKICKKYGLVYAPISRYIGTVPDKNLKIMLDFKIDEKDECYVKKSRIGNGWTVWIFADSGFVSYDEHLESIKNPQIIKSLDPYSNQTHIINESVKCPLEIAAPIKDFDTSRMEVVDYKLADIPDPIILKPVIFKSTKHYIIITAWGQEASDELVVNQKMN